MHNGALYIATLRKILLILGDLIGPPVAACKGAAHRQLWLAMSRIGEVRKFGSSVLRHCMIVFIATLPAALGEQEGSASII